MREASGEGGGSVGAVARRDRERVGEARPNEYRSLRPEPQRRRGGVEKPPRSPACLIGDAGAEDIRAQFAWHEIDWGTGWKIFGRPILQRHRGRHVALGDRLMLRSGRARTPSRLPRPWSCPSAALTPQLRWARLRLHGHPGTGGAKTVRTGVGGSKWRTCPARLQEPLRK